jgi:hypothetical protein
VEYTDSTYTSRFSIIDRIRLSHPIGCHCRVFPNNNPHYIPSAESCCGCQVNSLYHRIHKRAIRSGGTRWNLLTESQSTRPALSSAKVCAPVLPVPREAEGSLPRACPACPERNRGELAEGTPSASRAAQVRDVAARVARASPHGLVQDTPKGAPSRHPGEAKQCKLYSIRALLDGHVAVEPPEPAGPRNGTGERRYTNGSGTASNPAEEQAFDAFLAAEGQLPSSVAALRQWVLDNPDQAS